jgi:hypothetical protein
MYMSVQLLVAVWGTNENFQWCLVFGQLGKYYINTLLNSWHPTNNSSSCFILNTTNKCCLWKLNEIYEFLIKWKKLFFWIYANISSPFLAIFRLCWLKNMISYSRYAISCSIDTCVSCEQALGGKESQRFNKRKMKSKDNVARKYWLYTGFPVE